MKKLLPDQVSTQVKQILAAQLVQPVALLFFGRQEDCPLCGETRQLLQEVAELSDKLSLREYDLDADPETAQKYRVNKAPGIVLAGRDGDSLVDYGIKFAGVPSGYEFSSLINDLVLVSGRDSKLQAATRQALHDITTPVLLQVFTTPT